MNKISSFLNRIAHWKSFLLFLAMYLLFAGYLLQNAENKINELAGKTVGVIDLTIGFSPKKTLAMVAEYGDKARAYYIQTEMTTDVIYPIIYAFLFSIILSLLYRNKSNSWVNTIPFLPLLFDYLENVNIVILLSTFPTQSPLVATLCEVFKLLKWASFAVIVLLIIAGLISLLFNRKKASTP